MIYARKDKPNSQIYKLYVNEDSTFLSVYRELEIFENAFSALIEETKIRFVKENESWPFSKSKSSDVFSDLLLIYHHVLGIYLTYSMLKWPAEVNDEAMLTKIYAIVIYKMLQIQIKLSKSFKVPRVMRNFKPITFGQVFSPIMQEFSQHMFLLQPKLMVKIMNDFRMYKMREEIVPILKTVWEIGFPICLYTDLKTGWLPHDEDKFRDWSFAVGNYLYKNKNKIHVDKEVWDMLGPLPES